ncbi:MAG: hypothetical protein AB2404_06545, partial [Planifilum fimeticola]
WLGGPGAPLGGKLGFHQRMAPGNRRRRQTEQISAVPAKKAPDIPVPLLPAFVNADFYTYKNKQVVKSPGMFSLCHLS